MRLARSLILPILLSLLAASARADTLKYCSEASPATFDPAQTNSLTDFDATAHNVFDQLVQNERGTLKLGPGLAERWEIGDEGRSYTFHLRRNVAFHQTPWFKPTRRFNADDVLFTFGRLLDPQHPFRRAYPAESSYVADYGLDKLIIGIDRLDDYTVRFRLRAPMATFLINLHSQFASIHSAEYAEQLLRAGTPERIATHPVGTGPFVFKSFQKDVAVRYGAHPGYWRPELHRVANLIFVITPDRAARIQKLRTGECDLIAYPGPQDLPALRNEPQLKVVSEGGNNIGYLAYNVQRPPLDRLEVRQALDLAINRRALLDAVYQGSAVAAETPVPPTTWNLERPPRPAHDLAAARKLLERSGVKAGDISLKLWALPVQRAYNPNGRLMAEMIQADWARIGVKAEIITLEWGEYIRRVKRGEHDVAMFGWTATGDPDRFLSLLACDAIDGNNIARWCDAEFDGLVTRARQLSDQTKRAPLYRDAQRIFARQVPWTPLAHGRIEIPTRRTVRDFLASPDGSMFFVGVRVD